MAIWETPYFAASARWETFPAAYSTRIRSAETVVSFARPRTFSC